MFTFTTSKEASATETKLKSIIKKEIYLNVDECQIDLP